MTQEANSGDVWNPTLYDAKHAFVWQHGAALVDLLAPKAGERILDVGCGTGHLTAKLAESGARVIGIDNSAEMIAIGRRNFPQLCLESGDVRSLTFQREFDAVFSNAALHWVLEADRAAQSIARALKPGGRFVAELGGHGNVRRIHAALRDACRRLLGEEVASPTYFPTVAEYASVLEKAGLEVAIVHLFDRPTPLDGADGMRNWIAMFGRHFLARVPADSYETFLEHVETDLRPTLFREGTWFADYRRLRVVAHARMA
jgi:trans-aconitate methyltransferase